MKINLFFIAISFVFSTTASAYAENTFFPENNVKVKVTTSDSKANYEIDSGSKIISKEIPVETEKAIKINIEDYNFDGHKDIAISHIDDGMGNFTAYRIFLYSTKSQDFEEIIPDCGDQFLNLKVDSKRKLLISTYYKENLPAICETHPKNDSNKKR